MNLGLVGVYWSKGWWRWWWQLDYWSYKSCKAPVKSSPPANQHPVFYRPDALPVAQPTVSKHWREKYHLPWTWLPWGLPTLSLTTNSSWLPWGRVANLPCLSSAQNTILKCSLKPSILHCILHTLNLILRITFRTVTITVTSLGAFAPAHE